MLLSPGREEKGDLVSPSHQSRRWFTDAGEMLALKTALSSTGWGCWLCSCPLEETLMLSEPAWRALLKALSAFSSFIPPVSKLKPSLGTKDMCDMLSLCCKNVVLHPSAKMMLKIRKSQQAAQYLQVTCRDFHGHLSVGALPQHTQPMLWQQP